MEKQNLSGIAIAKVTNSSMEQRPVSKDIGVYGIVAAKYIFNNWPDKIVHCADFKTNNILGIAHNLKEAKRLFKNKSK